MKTRNLLSFLSVPFAATGVGCGEPLVDESYRGEPLVTLTGTVQNPLALEPADDAAVYLLWQPQVATQGEPIDFTTVRVDVEATFPAEFEIDIFVPPPDDTLFATYGGGQGALGGIVMATEAQLDLIVSGTATAEDLGVLGVSYSTVLYIPTDEDTALVAAAVPGAVRGFNLIVEDIDCQRSIYAHGDCSSSCEPDACEAECGPAPTCEFRYLAPTDTPITIELQGPEA